MLTNLHPLGSSLESKVSGNSKHGDGGEGYNNVLTIKLKEAVLLKTVNDVKKKVLS